MAERKVEAKPQDFVEMFESCSTDMTDPVMMASRTFRNYQNSRKGNFYAYTVSMIRQKESLDRKLNIPKKINVMICRLYIFDSREKRDKFKSDNDPSANTVHKQVLTKFKNHE